MASSVLFVLAFLLVAANAAKLPPTWKTCKTSLPPPEYDKCIHGAVLGVAQELLKIGAPTLGIPPMEPLKITKLQIGQGSGPVAVDITFEDLKLKNLASLQLDNIRHKEVGEGLKFGGDVHLTKPLVLDSKYELQGKVLVLPIKGKGDAHLELDNFHASFDLSGTPFKKGNQTYFKIEDFVIDFKTDRLHMKFDNLFDGNKELGDNMNVFLNENWEPILKELKPAITEALSVAFKGIANQIFTNIPWNQIRPA